MNILLAVAETGTTWVDLVLPIVILLVVAGLTWAGTWLRTNWKGMAEKLNLESNVFVDTIVNTALDSGIVFAEKKAVEFLEQQGDKMASGQKKIEALGFVKKILDKNGVYEKVEDLLEDKLEVRLSVLSQESNSPVNTHKDHLAPKPKEA